ncbi:MAG: hypothetical protein OQJ96_02900 [Flavobacteriales bacterium]|nr:hypothetical protein [Flavobacteriales bacterium]MCW8913129.1 hypothetical protein [Flavobacteriales bacterium]MCW8937790.1 hypothetical protein [Flavobacteriales bacterium]MCW8940040.1 hypothetical protein [Flavobacteriales bacterium]MCW8967398.1 hypothetical protein [Flavobacteriales bacterium]
MENSKQHLEALSGIKDLMEKSTKFISLSGLSGVIAGITALIGAFIANLRIDHYLNSTFTKTRLEMYFSGNLMEELAVELFIIATVVLVISVTFGILLTLRESKKNGQYIWGKNSKLLLLNLIVPLATGGIFCLILIYHGLFYLLAPATLLFYGLALFNCGKYTLGEIKYLGILQIILGLISAVFIGKGLLFWSIGFGVLHIVYGALMHFKYNNKPQNA